MYVYRRTEVNEERQFEVGYWRPGAESVFLVASRHETVTGARRRVNYLNGGPVPVNTGAES